MAVSIRQQPFQYHKISKGGVNDPQLTYLQLEAELTNLKGIELGMFIRAYVQERTPAAFASEPMLWESVREWLAMRIKVHPREIGLSGSAQSGFSLKPTKRGVPFDPTASDLDFFVVSEIYWESLSKEITLFISRNSVNSSYVEQAKTVSKQVSLCYLDLNQIPAVHDKYPTIATARNEVSITVDRLKGHGFSLKPSHLRVYKNWSALGAWVRRSYVS